MVKVVLRVGIALALGLGVIGCSDGTDSMTDAAVPDSGDDDPCLGNPAPTDSGTPNGCNPVTGGRCNVANHETCVWSYRNDLVECACSYGTATLEQDCRTDRVTCAPGLACLRIEAETSPKCHQVCELALEDGCDRLSEADPANLYRCAPIGNGQGTAFSEVHGICVVLGTACDPLDDRCDVSEACGFLGTGTGCIPAGTPQIGELCAEGLCAKGGMCARIGTLLPAQCYQPCNLTQSSCTTGVCRDVGYPFGLCF